MTTNAVGDVFFFCTQATTCHEGDRMLIQKVSAKAVLTDACQRYKDKDFSSR